MVCVNPPLLGSEIDLAPVLTSVLLALGPLVDVREAFPQANRDGKFLVETNPNKPGRVRITFKAKGGLEPHFELDLMQSLSMGAEEFVTETVAGLQRAIDHALSRRAIQLL